MAVSGAQLTRIGQYNAGVAKKVTITAKIAYIPPAGSKRGVFIGKNINRGGLR